MYLRTARPRHEQMKRMSCITPFGTFRIVTYLTRVPRLKARSLLHLIINNIHSEFN